MWPRENVTLKGLASVAHVLFPLDGAGPGSRELHGAGAGGPPSLRPAAPERGGRASCVSTCWTPCVLVQACSWELLAAGLTDTSGPVGSRLLVKCPVAAPAPCGWGPWTESTPRILKAASVFHCGNAGVRLHYEGAVLACGRCA